VHFPLSNKINTQQNDSSEKAAVINKAFNRSDVNMFAPVLQFTVHSKIHCFKGVVYFCSANFADNLLTPMSSKMSMSFFIQSKRN